MASGLAQGALVRTPRIYGPCCRLVLLDISATRSGLGVRIGRAFRSHHLAHLTSGRQGYAGGAADGAFRVLASERLGI